MEDKEQAIITRKNGEDYDKLTIPDGHIGNVVGKWFGYKAAIYNLPSTGHYKDDSDVPVYPVKIELWIDETENHDDDIDTFKPKNNFVKKMETFDSPLDTHYELWGDDGGWRTRWNYFVMGRSSGYIQSRQK